MRAIFTQVEFILGLVPGFFTVYVIQVMRAHAPLVQKWLSDGFMNLRI